MISLIIKEGRRKLNFYEDVRCYEIDEKNGIIEIYAKADKKETYNVTNNILMEVLYDKKIIDSIVLIKNDNKCKIEPRSESTKW